MRHFFPALLTLAMIGTGAPAMAAAASPAAVRLADGEVVRQARLTREAVQQGDAATIAVARAKLQAARAAAWGKRHPARAPAARVAVK
ncbi:hypothetical protein [Sphingomonas sp.]|uniref:hypothetical protein n=1 Tax=Sphingomonas sp. TaxID=28214 RepID=UPI0025D90913|nr:hypothetical protein [Sphingomonas sp.]